MHVMRRPDVSASAAAAGATGADLANMVNEAALLAGRANKGARPGCRASAQKVGVGVESAGRVFIEAVYASRASCHHVSCVPRPSLRYCERAQQQVCACPVCRDAGKEPRVVGEPGAVAGLRTR